MTFVWRKHWIFTVVSLPVAHTKVTDLQRRVGNQFSDMIMKTWTVGRSEQGKVNDAMGTCVQWTHLLCCQLCRFRYPWWRHQMETFSALLALSAGNSPVTGEFPHKGQWRGALMFSLICAWINGWVNNREAGDLRRYRAHYDVTVMLLKLCMIHPVDSSTCESVGKGMFNDIHEEFVRCNLKLLHSAWEHNTLHHGNSAHWDECNVIYPNQILYLIATGNFLWKWIKRAICAVDFLYIEKRNWK